MRKYGIEMHLPDGKRPGYYAQVVKALAAVPLFDREKELLIVSSEKERLAVLELMHEYRFEYEEIDLYLLPHDSDLRPAFDDYGFVSPSERPYLYTGLAFVFRFETASGAEGSEQGPALLQMDEHLIASFRQDGVHYYAVDRTLEDLIRGIAKAYRCEVAFVDMYGR